MIASCRLYLLLTRSLCRHPSLETLEAALRGGVDLVQAREKPFGEDAEEWIADIVETCEPHGVPVIVNDRIDLAVASDAIGVHLGMEDLEAHTPGRLQQRPCILGISTHNPAELERAMQEAPDYVGVGNCFATRTKGLETGLAPEQIRQLLELCEVPAFAIGGITSENLPELLALGVERIAVSSAILQASDPGAAARDLRELLDDVR